MKRVAGAPLPDARLELWAIDQGKLFTTWKTTADPDAAWTAWSEFATEVVEPNPSPVTAIAVAPLPDGRLELWVSTDQGKLFTTWKTTVDPNASWVGWTEFATEVAEPNPNGVTDVAVASLPDGRLELWVSTDQSKLFTTWKTTVDPNASWVDWTEFATEVAEPNPSAVTHVAVAPLSDGRLELWVSTDQGKLFTTWKTTVDPNAEWAGWTEFATEVAEPNPSAVTHVAVAPLSDGRLELWVSTDQGKLSTTWKTAVDPDAEWVGWTEFATEIVAPNPIGVTHVAVAPLLDGRLELWVSTDQDKLLTTWKTAADSNATWAAWSDFVAGGGWLITEPFQPPEEDCDHEDPNQTGFFDAPSPLINCPDANCGRLIALLRTAAKEQQADQILISAAFAGYVVQHPELPSPFPADLEDLPSAFADLAVTGRAAYRSFRQLALRDSDLIAPVTERLVTQFPGHQPVAADVGNAVRQALQRAYKVAWAIRGPVKYRHAQRRKLGWIAVDGEDDPPHRPVNVPSALFPQYNMTVQVPATPLAQAVVTRYVVASRHISDDYPVDVEAVPPEPAPPLIVGDIVLFIHGHSSSSEEAMPLIGPLLQQAGAKRRHVTVIAMDLPSSGYASMVDHTVACPEEPLWNTGYPVLDFIENFIVAFVDKLDAQQPGVKKQIIGVIGGSLGGNMTLRLARRDPTTHPWLHSVVSWSPASTWLSWARAVLGPATAGRFTDSLKHEAVGRTNGAMKEAEVDAPHFRSSLNKFFYQEFAGNRIGRIAQADHWFSASWPCRNAAKTGAHRGTYEIYNAIFRQWHWRVAHEQLIFSHWDSDNLNLAVDPDPRNNPAAGPARYAQIKSRVLLATGKDDDLPLERIFLETTALANAMTMVNGTTLFLEKTGHSIAIERPIFFANRILEFLFVSPPTVRSVWIPEINYNPPGHDIDSEYVDIQNDSAAAVEMDGWSLRDLKEHVFTFPQFVLQPGSAVKVWTRAGANDARNLFWGRRAAVWNNTGDRALLRDQHATEVATYTY